MRIAKISVLLAMAALLAGCKEDYGGFDSDGYKIIRFRDGNFKSMLLEKYECDKNGDGEISVAEAANPSIQTINFDNSEDTYVKLTDIGEIKYFTGVTGLSFRNHDLKGEIDLRKLHYLRNIDFMNNTSDDGTGQITKIILYEYLDVARLAEPLVDKGTIVECNEEYAERFGPIRFNDVNFKFLLIEKYGYDANGDGEISIAEIAASKNKVIDFDNSEDTYVKLTDIGEITHFTEVTTLSFNNHNLKGEIDLRYLHKLEKIDFRNNSSANPGQITKVLLYKGLENNKKVEIFLDPGTEVEYQDHE